MEDENLVFLCNYTNELQAEYGDLLSRLVVEKKIPMDSLLKLCVENKRMIGLEQVAMMLTKLQAKSFFERGKLIATKQAGEDVVAAKLVSQNRALELTW